MCNGTRRPSQKFLIIVYTVLERSGPVDMWNMFENSKEYLKSRDEVHRAIHIWVVCSSKVTLRVGRVGGDEQ